MGDDLSDTRVTLTPRTRAPAHTPTPQRRAYLMSDTSRPASLDGRHVDAMFSHLVLFVFGALLIVSAVNTTWTGHPATVVGMVATLAFSGGLALRAARHLSITRRLVLADPTADADWQRAARHWFI